jgi:hypothetical protein
MNPKEVLSPIVVRGEFLIGDRPVRRHTARMLNLAKIRFTQSRQCRAINLGVSADEVVHPRREPPTARVPPLLLGLVAVLGEDGLWTPVLRFARQKVPAFEEQDSSAAVS